MSKTGRREKKCAVYRLSAFVLAFFAEKVVCAIHIALWTGFWRSNQLLSLPTRLNLKTGALSHKLKVTSRQIVIKNNNSKLFKTNTQHSGLFVFA